jgi:predicted Fe-Mo cluster-binding NifX family protein
MADHFGRAPFYAVVDPEAGTVEVVPNGAPDHAGPHQFGQMLGSLLEPGRFDAVACGGLGAPALERLAAAGKVVYIHPGPTLGDAARAHLAGELRPVGSEDAACCGGHEHDH